MDLLLMDLFLSMLYCLQQVETPRTTPSAIVRALRHIQRSVCRYAYITVILYPNTCINNPVPLYPSCVGPLSDGFKQHGCI